MAKDQAGVPRASSETRIPMRASVREVDEERARQAASYVLVCELARFLKREKGTMRAILSRLDIVPVKVRAASGQLVSAITAEDARRVIASEPRPVKVINPNDL